MFSFLYLITQLRFILGSYIDDYMASSSKDLEHDLSYQASRPHAFLS